MTITYTHDHADQENNPNPPSLSVIEAVAQAIDFGSRKAGGPLTRTADIMGFKLSPSPELHGAGYAVLEVDYSDGKTLTFDVNGVGGIEPRKYAYAFAAVLETTEPLSEDDGMDNALSFISDTFMNWQEIDASVEWTSTPRRCTYRPNDDYDVQPYDGNAGRIVP